MKKINLLALLICACLLMSCFAACSHRNVTVDSDNETSITENESFRDHGFTEQEFVGEELENVEPEEEDPDDSDLENLSFDDDYLGEE